VKKEERRQQILDAARKVFATRGYHEAKVEDIAAAARVAKGTVYLYFSDKRSIFAELIDDLFTRIAAAILRVDTSADVAAQIKHNIRAILSVLVDDPHTMRMLFSQASAVDASFSSKIQSFFDGLRQLLSESLEEGQELGIVAPGDTRLYAAFTLGALREILEDTVRRAEGQPTRERIVEAMFELLQRGYLRMEPAPAKPSRPRKK
jgi:AcrR family transcriptional regulator